MLVDTNVISELRKGRKAAPELLEWMSHVDEDDLFLSVLVVGEIRKGIERLGRRDAVAAHALEMWLRQVTANYSDRILPITTDIAETWGRFNVPDPLPVIDSLLAATAHVHGMTVVTRNVSDIAPTGVPVVNPFDVGPAVGDG